MQLVCYLCVGFIGYFFLVLCGLLGVLRICCVCTFDFLWVCKGWFAVIRFWVSDLWIIACFGAFTLR